MSCETQNFKLEAVYPRWGKENVVKVVGAAALTGGEYFLISDQTVDYYVWAEVSGAGADPALAGKTALKLELPASYTVAQLNDEIIDVLDTTGKKFYVSEAADQTYVCIETLDIGAPKTAASAGTSGFTVTTLTAGISVDLGATADGVEITMETSLFDIVPNQNGTLLADQIMQGANVSCSLGLIQVSKDKLEQIVGGGVGDVLTVGTDKLIGFGTSKNFQSTFQYAGRLILHPVRLASNDRSEDANLMKCLPVMDSISYSGTDLLTLNLSFSGLPDQVKSSKVKLFAWGDSSKYLK
jgi:hypothetical protein